jgi:predicted secreted protein
MRALIAAALLIACSGGARAQHERHHEPPADVVNLQAEASREVENDQLVAVLAAEAQGANPAELAESVNKKMAEALKAAKEVQSVKLRSGNYQTFPNRGKEGRIEGWQVSQELRLESSDAAAAAKLIGRLQQSLNVRSMAMRLAPQSRRAAEDALITEAVAAFEARAEVVRKALKAKSYSVRELSIGAGGGGPRPMQYEFAAAAPRAAPVAIEAGVSQVSVTVSGSIQLQR